MWHRGTHVLLATARIVVHDAATRGSLRFGALPHALLSVKAEARHELWAHSATSNIAKQSESSDSRGEWCKRWAPLSWTAEHDHETSDNASAADVPLPTAPTTVCVRAGPATSSRVAIMHMQLLQTRIVPDSDSFGEDEQMRIVSASALQDLAHDPAFLATLVRRVLVVRSA